MDYYNKLHAQHNIFCIFTFKMLAGAQLSKDELKKKLEYEQLQIKESKFIIYACIILHICDLLSINPPHSQNFQKLLYFLTLSTINGLHPQWFLLVLVCSTIQL